MGYILRVRLASFFAGSAAASALGFYLLYHDYQTAHRFLNQQVRSLRELVDERTSALEKISQSGQAASQNEICGPANSADQLP